MRNLVSAALAGAIAMILTDASLALAADKWVSVRSPNVLVVGSASEARMRRVASDLEQFRAVFSMLFPGAGQPSSSGTLVMVFKDDLAFRSYKPLYQGKPANVDGYFLSGSDLNVIALNGEIDTPSIVYHEFVHAMTRNTTQRLPEWASEGIAEFYSTFRASQDGTTADLGRPVDAHLALLQQQPLIALDTLLAVDQKSPYYNEQSKQGIFYAQSWALVHYLMVGKGGTRRSQLPAYLALVSAGQPVDDSFREAFHTDYRRIEGELRDYLRQFTMTFVRVKLNARVEVERTARAEAMSEARSAAYLGDLLVRMGRDDAGEKELRRAMSLDPALAASYVSMGRLRLREEKDKEALEFLSRAIQADTQDYVAHFLYAQLLQKPAPGESDDTQRGRLELTRRHLKRSIELAPHFVDAYGLLAYVTLLLGNELPETETALRKALDLAPGREDLRLVHAELMASNGKELAAQAVVSEIRRTTADDLIRRQAETLFESIQGRIEFAQASRDFEARRNVTNPGLRVEGFLTMMDCAQGMSLDVRTERGVVHLHSDMPARISFVSHVAALKDAIACGPFKPELHVVITYEPGSDPAYLGDPLVVEFQP